MMEPIPIKDILENPDHPMHAVMNEMVDKLDRGEIRMCGCMGPMYGEPYCPCKMDQMKLPRSPKWEEDIVSANKRLDELFGPGGEYDRVD